MHSVQFLNLLAFPCLGAEFWLPREAAPGGAALSMMRTPLLLSNFCQDQNIIPRTEQEPSNIQSVLGR